MTIQFGYVQWSSYLIDEVDESFLILVSVIARMSKLTFNSQSSMLKWSKFLVSEQTFIWKKG